MILVQLAFRAWALYGGWFLIDDFGFLAGAVDRQLSIDYLFTPYGDHLQPFGFLIVWLVAQSTPYDWALASTITLGLQALASSACWAFLIRLCGMRWAALVPLGFYLFSALTLPALMWWAAAIVQVPLQLAAFLAMAFHVEYVRSGRLLYLALASTALVLGMLCDVKVAFIALSLGFLSLYLADAAGLRGRVREVLARQKTAWVTYGVLFVGYLALYLELNSVGGREPVAWASIFEVMVRYTVGPVVAGGPWQWGEMGTTPLVPVQPPEWAVTIAWVALALLAAAAVRQRPATAWVGVLLLAAFAVNAAMLATARGDVFGGLAALELRYSGDLAPTLVLAVAVLAVSLAPQRTLPPPADITRGSHRVTAPARHHLLATSVLLLVATVGSFVSSTAYALNWHSDYPAREFFQNVAAQAEQRPLVLLDQQVPLDVLPREGPTKFEVPSQIFTPLGNRVVAAMRMNDPEILDPEGIAYRATIKARRESPAGPVEGCGYPVDDRPRSITLEQVDGEEPVSQFWWASIGYLGAGDGLAAVSFNGMTTDMEVKAGLHDFFFLGSGPADEVTLQMRSSVGMCVDNVRVGELEPNDEEVSR